MAKNITLSVSEELGKKMEHHKEIRWSEVARQAIEKKINDLEFLEKVVGKSRLTKEDAEKLSKKINKNVSKKFRSL